MHDMHMLKSPPMSITLNFHATRMQTLISMIAVEFKLAKVVNLPEMSDQGPTDTQITKGKVYSRYLDITPAKVANFFKFKPPNFKCLED